ncbi:MAG: endonuclease V [Candidatus Eiseniibacteriota bacterium]|nr:MAG: endonuclease V [Candidatus Eisenbacteria bacterium]
MKVRKLHDWDLDSSGARQLQYELASLIEVRALPSRISSVAGADVALEASTARAGAAIAVLSFPDLALRELVTAEGKVRFPYVPGLLTFREGPILIEALKKLSSRPDVILFDGQGIAHFRGMGIASHVGLFAGLPTVGCAKSPLLKPGREPGPKRGATSPIRREGHLVGVALRTRSNVRPVYVSPGHLADVSSSVRLVLDCCTRFRIPEPLRVAHRECGKALRRDKIS